MNLTLRFAMFLHVTLIILQVANQLSTFVPAEYKPTVMTVLLGAQAAIGWLQHHVNTDGTPQAVPFIPKS